MLEFSAINPVYQALLHITLLHSKFLHSRAPERYSSKSHSREKNSSFGSLTQLHCPYDNTLLACQKPSTFMSYSNQLDLQLRSRLQIYCQWQQPYHGCKSTFLCVRMYYNIIIIILREIPMEPRSSCPISKRGYTLSSKNPFALSDSNRTSNRA